MSGADDEPITQVAATVAMRMGNTIVDLRRLVAAYEAELRKTHSSAQLDAIKATVNGGR